jgi:hypothetical protein
MRERERERETDRENDWSVAVLFVDTSPVD